MQNQIITIYAKLVAKQSDGFGYTNYVFEDLEYQNYDFKYIMCVQFPNWNQSIVNLNDVGFVTVRYVREGIDKWYDGEKFNVFNYTNCVFLKFIPEKEQININEISLD